MTNRVTAAGRRPASRVVAGIGLAIVIVGGIVAEWAVAAHRHAEGDLRALTYLQEAGRLEHRRPAVASHLVALAAMAAGLPAPRGHLLPEISTMQAVILNRLTRATVPSAVPVAVTLVLAAAVILYWVKERTIERIAADQQLLRTQLLAISEAWVDISREFRTEEAVERILHRLRKHTVIQSAYVYRIDETRPDDALTLYAYSGRPMAFARQPVPRPFLAKAFGLLGRAIEADEPVYTGDTGEYGTIIPGLRLERAGIYPLRYQTTRWGVMVLQADEPGWFYRYRDLLDVIGQEIAVLLINGNLAEEARKTAMYQEMVRVRSEILANVSHELRTPLGLIKGYVDTVATAGDRLSAAQREEFLGVVQEETRQLEQLIGNLLYMSRIESVGLTVEPKWFAFRPWAESMVRRLAGPDQERIQIAVPGDGTGSLWGDAGQLAHALGNMMQNSLKYARGSIMVEGDCRQGLCRLTVSDEGPGVSPDDLDRIFERFYRIPSHAVSEIRGSGLGLSIARRVIEAHGGRIWAANRTPTGLAVTAEWPAPR